MPRRLRAEPQAAKQLQEMGEAKDFADVAWLDHVESGGDENGSAALTVQEIGPDLLIDADVSKRAFVATSVPDWPGWRAESAGKELALTTVNHAFVGFWLPPGRHEIRLHYLPQSFRVGAAVALAALVAGALLLVRRGRRVLRGR